MRTLLGALVYILVMFGGTFKVVRGSIFLTKDSSIKFSQCLVEKMSASAFFSQEDRIKLINVASLMVSSMDDTAYGPEAIYTRKILAISCVTAAGNIVVLKDYSERNYLRKGAYQLALDECSLSAVGYIDTDFVSEAWRIMTALEVVKSQAHDNPSGFERVLISDGSNINPGGFAGEFDPSAVQPSPVQRPFITGIYSNGKTEFDSSGSSSFGTSSGSTFSTSRGSSAGTLDISPLGTSSGSSFETSGVSSFDTLGGSSFSTSGGSVSGTSRDSSFDASGRSLTSGASSFGTSGASTSGISRSSSFDTSETSFSDTSRGFSTDTLRNSSSEGSGGSFSGTVGSSSISTSGNSPFGTSGGLNSGVSGGSTSGTFKNTKSSSSQTSQTSFKPEHSRQGESDLAANIAQSGNYSQEGASSSSFSQERNISPSTGSNPLPEFEGLSVPQTKESKVMVIPPEISSEHSENVPLPDPSVENPEETLIEPAYVPLLPENIESDTEISQFPFADADSTSPSLESIIANVLKNSTYFINAFGLGIDKQKAINIARVIAQQSFSGYDSDIINEALNAVSAAVATVTFSSPENYALAISAALATVLRLHGLSLFTEGTNITSSMVTNLDNSKAEFNQQTEYSESVQNSSMEDNPPPPWNQPPEPPFNFQSSILALEDVEGEIFSTLLSQFLTGSIKMTNLFCGNNVLPDMATYFLLTKSALSDYGTQISSIAASAISGTLIELSADSLCSGFAHVIADSIAEVLYENGLLEEADPEEISKKFDFCASNLQETTTKHSEPQTIKILDTSTKEVGANTDKITPTHQSSFTDDYPKRNSTTFDHSPAVYLPTTIMDAYSNQTATEDDSITQQQNEKNVAETNQDTVVPVEKRNPEHESLNYQTIPVPTPMTTEISDQELSSALALTELFIYVPDESSTESDSSSYPVINEEEMAEIESVIKVSGDRSDELEQVTTIPDKMSLEETLVHGNISPDREGSSTKEPIFESKSQTGGTARTIKPRPNRRKHGRKQTTTTQPYSEINSSDARSVANAYSQVAGKSGSNQQGSFAISQAKASNEPVELYPSFQGPVPSDPSSTSRKLPEDSNLEDLSLIFSRAVSTIASFSITYIRSSENFNFDELCGRLNTLAVAVGIPPLDNCRPIFIIDYLLNVLMAVTKILKGV